MQQQLLFTPKKLGAIELKNRSIRSAAFENMGKNYSPTEELVNYHKSVAKGGVAMTTVAYASVNRSGISFDGQLWIRQEIMPELRRLADEVHSCGAKVSIQLGHCGNMTHWHTAGQMPVGASTRFNLYSPTFARKLKEKEILQIVKDFGNAVKLVKEAGFDAVEIHAGHGYLISQFLSPYTNRRRDKFGGSLNNRMRFMQMVIEEVLNVANREIAVVVKTNMYDGFRSGLQIDDCITVAKELERLGVDALVLSAGFVSKAPMTVMHGAMPVKTLAHYMDMKKYWWLKAMIRLFGRFMMKSLPYSEGFFLEDAKRFRKELKLPLIYVGGLIAGEKIEEVLNSGFDFVQMARVLINDPEFINHLKEGGITYRSNCGHSNYCIGRMYSKPFCCHHCAENLPKKIEKEIEKAERY
ncbi:MAG: NADH:flavin oxidoreductase [Prevotellaceae bacterium]|jgi:2,4-dienoyl-CoA reductase-like NADH-dependent reductase (Old Yellow Enzyme family)|nr:NADH:flavin oxidoreductase [Prevotellaceae bacterium]